MGGSETYRLKKKITGHTKALGRARSPSTRMQAERNLRTTQKKLAISTKQKTAQKFYTGKRLTAAEKKTVNRATSKGYSARLFAAQRTAAKRGIKL